MDDLERKIEEAVMASPLSAPYGRTVLQAIEDAGYVLCRRGKRGGGRPVITPAGKFPSVAAAARALGISPSTAAYYAKTEQRGIRYSGGSNGE